MEVMEKFFPKSRKTQNWYPIGVLSLPMEHFELKIYIFLKIAKTYLFRIKRK